MPDANIGIATGKASNLAAPVVDGPEGEALLAELQRQLGPLPPTITVKTNKGRHLWFRNPKNVAKIKSVAREELKLDVRGDGGYVVAPPSVHESGHVYAFASLKTLAECPAWLVEYANGNLSTLVQPPTSSSPEVTNGDGRPLLLAAANVAPPPPHTEIEEVRLRSALACIPADERQIWCNVGMALHWLGWGEPAFRLWDHWSRTAPKKYNEASQHKTWASFDRPYDGPPITVATIFHMAKEHGWTENVHHASPVPEPASNNEAAQPTAAGHECNKQIISAADVRRIKFEPVHYILPRFIPEGVTLLVGRPKVGKSWLVLDLCLACAGGHFTLGAIKPAQGDVLYLALEDGKRRLRQRLDKLMPTANGEWPERLKLVSVGGWRRADQGGLADIDAWCKSVPNPVLVVVDTLERIRKPFNSKTPLYSADYEAITGLQKIATDYGIAIVVLHHDRKSEADDTFDTVSGTLGLIGAADTILIVKRRTYGVVLYARGRDIEESETAMQFDKATFRWTILGAASEVHRSNERARVISVLKAAGQPLSTKEIMIHAEMQSRNAVDILLFKMVNDGKIRRVARGRYDLSTKGNGQIGQKERLDSEAIDSIGQNANLSNLSDLSGVGERKETGHPK
jgi:RecA-family ATPase